MGIFHKAAKTLLTMTQLNFNAPFLGLVTEDQHDAGDTPLIIENWRT